MILLCNTIDYGRDIQSKSNIIKYFSHTRFTPPKNEELNECKHDNLVKNFNYYFISFHLWLY